MKKLMNDEVLERVKIEDQLTQNFIRSAHSQFGYKFVEELVQDKRELRILMFALSTLWVSEAPKFWRRQRYKEEYFKGLAAIAYVLAYIDN